MHTAPTAGNPLNALKVLPGIQSLEDAASYCSDQIIQGFSANSMPGTLSGTRGLLIGSSGESGLMSVNGGNPEWTIYRWRNIRIPRNRHFNGLPTAPSVIPAGIPVGIQMYGNAVPLSAGFSPGSLVSIFPETHQGISTADEQPDNFLQISLSEVSYSHIRSIARRGKVLLGIQKSVSEYTLIPLFNWVNDAESSHSESENKTDLLPGSANFLLSLTYPDFLWI